MEVEMRKSTSKIIFIVLVLWFCGTLIGAEKVDLKKKAMDAFENANYPEAISLLKEAVAKNPNDAEIWYYLGYYTHYLCYDSRPLTGYDEEWSNKILGYLEKAIKLDPNYGNAYYFTGSEHGVRALFALQDGNLEKVRKELRMGREKGGYPDWLLEYGRNTLNSCDSNAILITGGDPYIFPIWYLQFVEEYRTDVTAIPFALTRPWFPLMLKNGGIFGKVPISWSEEQILSMHLYKWKTRKMEIPIKKSIMEKYNIAPEDSIIEFELEPDLESDTRTYLGAGRALIVDIIETNQWGRPIYYSPGIPKKYKVGLDDYFQLQGLVLELLPLNTKEHNLTINPEKMERILLNPESYRDFASVKEHDMPRVSRILNNYHSGLCYLANYYNAREKFAKAKEILDKIKIYMPEEVFPVPDNLKKYIREFPGYLTIKELGIPKILLKTLSKKGIEATVKQYNELKDKHTGYIEFCEGSFNVRGYKLLGENRVKEAILVFRLNVALFPDSYNVYDSLGEAYMVAGEKELAIKNYKKSLDLNPKNKNAVERLKKLEKKK